MLKIIGTWTSIVFVHAWPVNDNIFRYQFTELPKHGYRCIGIDLRGFDDLDKPLDGYNYDTMSDDLSAVLDTLNLDDATLVGFFYGCGHCSPLYVSLPRIQDI